MEERGRHQLALAIVALCGVLYFFLCALPLPKELGLDPTWAKTLPVSGVQSATPTPAELGPAQAISGQASLVGSGATLHSYVRPNAWVPVRVALDEQGSALQLGLSVIVGIRKEAGEKLVSEGATWCDSPRELIDKVDVVLENFRPGVMQRLGLGIDVLHARNPRLVVASVSGYGQTGPWVHRRAYAPVVGAESGFTKAQGDARGGVYANDAHSHADVYTALECGAAVLAALFQRERTGRGEHIDISMAQTMLYVNEHAHDHLWDGDAPEGVVRSFRPMDYPVLVAANGEAVVISGHPAENKTFDYYMLAIDRADLLADERFATTAGRLEHLNTVFAAMDEWASRMADAQAILAQAKEEARLHRENSATQLEASLKRREQQAIDRMVAKAQALGANAVLSFANQPAAGYVVATALPFFRFQCPIVADTALVLMS